MVAVVALFALYFKTNKKRKKNTFLKNTHVSCTSNHTCTIPYWPEYETLLFTGSYIRTTIIRNCQALDNYILFTTLHILFEWKETSY